MLGQENNDETGSVVFTIRLPKDTHEWLRHEAFFGRTSMSAIVREEIEARRTREGGGHDQQRPGQVAPEN